VTKLVRKMLGLGILAAIGYAIWRAFQSRSQPSTITWEHQPFPYPPQPQPAPQHTESAVSGVGASGLAATALDATDGACPTTHPIKAKLASGIYHVPGGATYDRTRADRCYVDTAAAEADGLRPAKR
jgi:hypothetical protein